MATTQSRRPALDPTPLFAVVGVTDLAVERVRTAVANATAAQAEAQRQAQKAFADPKATAQELPSRAVALALETVSKAEAQYEDLARRGKELVDRVRTQRSTQDLFAQANTTLSRTRGAVTTARKAADDTATAVRGTLNIGRREATVVVDTSITSAETAATTTQRAAKRTTKRAEKNATATKSAAKGARTSASKTASAAKTAASDAAEKVGD